MSDRGSYYKKISLANKTPEEAERITKTFHENENIAYKIASKYYKTGYWDFDESIQIARMGLWKACLIWDPNKFRLSTLAYNIINRDFIDFDRQQKRQPDILFNLEDNCVTDDLSLNDVLIDEDASVEDEYEQSESMLELKQDIVYILDDIAEDLKIPKGTVKLVYVAYTEATKNTGISMKDVNFIKKSTIKEIINELQTRLKEVRK